MSESLPVLRQLRELAFRLGNEVSALEQANSGYDSGLIVLDLDTILAYHVGRQLLTFDRELRRTAAIQRSDGISLMETLPRNVEVQHYVVAEDYEQERPSKRSPRPARLPLAGRRPDAPTVSSLQVVGAEEGSTLSALQPLGALITLLTSQPLTALVNAAALSGSVTQLRAYLRRRPTTERNTDPLAGISARQALAVLKEFRGQLPAALDGREDSALDLSVGAGPFFRTADAGEIRGRRIHYIQDLPDGTRNWYVIE